MSRFDMFLTDILEAGSTPCEYYKCKNFRNCADKLLACDAFVYYVKTGRRVNPHMRVPLRVSPRRQLELGNEIVATHEKFLQMDRDESNDC